jgi:predicted metal-dependent phosphoesterase TrpH
MTNEIRKPLYIDLHTHTYYSDGILTPTDNVRTARINGIDILATTDHDKIEAYEEAKAAGEKYQIKVIPGVEISTDRYHILGLNPNINYPKFKAFIDYSNEEQKKVCIKRIETLKSFGIPISLEKVTQVFPKSRLGKMNIMYTMIQDRECQDYFMKHDNERLSKKLFDKYLRDAKGKWVEDKMTSITSKMAIDAVHAAGGIAILAHPPLDVKEMSEMDVLLREGIDGIEVQERNNGKNESFINFAKANNLLITYGSDYHGGVFERDILNNRGNNILSQELAKALRLEYL